MKQVLPFYLILLTFSALGQADQRYLDWSEKRLTWDDFKQDYHTGNPNFAAKVRWRFTLELEKSSDSAMYDRMVFAQIIPDASYVNPTAKSNVELLGHEQLHFDIVELHARKLRKDIRRLDLTSKDDSRWATKRRRSLFKDMSKMQNLYDSQTDHGKEKNSQAFWANKINLELQDLEKYRIDSSSKKSN